MRLATDDDAPAMVQLLNFYIEKSTATFLLEAQSIDERLAWMKEHTGRFPAIVAEAEGKFAGWGALSVFNPRGGYRHTAEVSVYVRPELHRRGIGRALLTELISRARAAEHHVLIAQCCGESRESIALHEALGFARAGELRGVGRKFDRWLDVVLLQLVL